MPIIADPALGNEIKVVAFTESFVCLLVRVTEFLPLHEEFSKDKMNVLSLTAHILVKPYLQVARRGGVLGGQLHMR